MLRILSMSWFWICAAIIVLSMFFFQWLSVNRDVRQNLLIFSIFQWYWFNFWQISSWLAIYVWCGKILIIFLTKWRYWCWLVSIFVTKVSFFRRQRSLKDILGFPKIKSLIIFTQWTFRSFISFLSLLIVHF